MFTRRHVLVANGSITTVSPTPIESPPGALVVDGPGILAQGFVDTHVHGRRGFDVMRPGDIAPLSLDLLAQGVTGFLPTVVAAPPDRLLAALSTACADPRGARVLGIHAEGPFLSPDQPGMFPPDAFRDYDRALWRNMQAAAASPIRVMTVAAERLTLAQIDELRVPTASPSASATPTPPTSRRGRHSMPALPASPTPTTPCPASTIAHREPSAPCSTVATSTPNSSWTASTSPGRPPASSPPPVPAEASSSSPTASPGRLPVRRLRLGRPPPARGWRFHPPAHRPPRRQRPHPGRSRAPRGRVAGCRPGGRALHGIRSPASLDRAGSGRS